MVDRGIRALVISRAASRADARAQPQPAATTSGLFDGWFPPNKDPWEQFPDPWKSDGALYARKMAVHDVLTRVRVRVHEAQPPLSTGDVASFDELYQNWLATFFQGAPTDSAVAQLYGYEKKANEWKAYLDQRDGTRASKAPILPIIGGLAVIGGLIYAVTRST